MWTMFANDEREGRYDGFSHVFRSKIQVGMCGDAPIVPVTVTEDPEGPYWGWIATGETAPSMIFRHKVQFEICFPYGVQVEVAAGKGRIVKLKVEKTLQVGDEVEFLSFKTIHPDRAHLVGKRGRISSFHDYCGEPSATVVEIGVDEEDGWYWPVRHLAR